MSQLEAAFFMSWAVTATLAAIWYYERAEKISKNRLWTIKMLAAIASGTAKITRDGNKITFHYENDKESNTISIESK